MHSLLVPWNYEKLQSTSNRVANVGSHYVIYKMLTNKVSEVKYGSVTRRLHP
jgi:hypothetical protein